MRLGAGARRLPRLAGRAACGAASRRHRGPFLQRGGRGARRAAGHADVAHRPRARRTARRWRTTSVAAKTHLRIVGGPVMTGLTDPVIDADLDAYVDDQLDVAPPHRGRGVSVGSSGGGGAGHGRSEDARRIAPGAGRAERPWRGRRRPMPPAGSSGGWPAAASSPRCSGRPRSPSWSPPAGWRTADHRADAR